MRDSIRIVDETPDALVIWKPAGLPVEMPRDPAADSLVARLRDAGWGDVRLVHRLDAGASGLMLVARTPAAAAHHAAEIAARRWHKVYVAEVFCAADRAAALPGTHRAYLKTTGRRAQVVRSGGKPSSLSVVLATPSGHRDRHHVLIRLHSGRYHQIRVMMASLGAPLTGDTLYGGPPGLLYLEQVVLGAVPLGGDRIQVWQAPADVGRPTWTTILTVAVAREAQAINEG